MSYIYVITNKINGKQYVGKTSLTIEQRFKEHLRQKGAKARKHYPLYNAMNKYGKENFIISVLEQCSEDESSDREKFWIEKLDTYYHGYNATFGGDGTVRVNREKVIETFLKCNNLAKTGRICHCKPDTVKNILDSYDIEYIPYNQGKKVCGQTQDGKIHYFDSIRQAGQWLTEQGYYSRQKDAAAHISQVCRGKRKTCGKMQWSFV